MQVHINTKSGGHFKLEGDDAQKFMDLFDGPQDKWISDTSTDETFWWLVFPAGKWMMTVRYDCIECVAVLDETNPLKAVD